MYFTHGMLNHDWYTFKMMHRLVFEKYGRDLLNKYHQIVRLAIRDQVVTWMSKKSSVNQSELEEDSSSDWLTLDFLLNHVTTVL